MLGWMGEKARQQEIFPREDTATKKRVLSAILYHAGLSFRKIEPFMS
jgi:putative transposase